MKAAVRTRWNTTLMEGGAVTARERGSIWRAKFTQAQMQADLDRFVPPDFKLSGELQVMQTCGGFFSRLGDRGSTPIKAVGYLAACMRVDRSDGRPTRKMPWITEWPSRQQQTWAARTSRFPEISTEKA